MKQYVIFLSFILCLAYQAKAQAIIDTIESPNGQDYTACFDSLYQNVKFSDAPYGILYDRVVPFARLQQFGITNSDTSSYWHFIQAYSELQRAAVAPQKELPLTVDKLKAMAVEATIPIGIINFDYSSLDTDAYHTGRLYRSNGLWHENSSIQGNLFTVHHAVVAAPLRQVLVGSTFDFMLAAGIVFSSQGAGISRVSIDFDNGNGLQVIGLDRKITVSYTSFGLKKMKFVITLADGSEVTTYARFRVVETEASDHTRSTSAYDCPRYVENQTVNAQIAFQGYDESQAYCGRAEVRYYFANSDRELRRPILIVDGFDPMDVRQFERHKENDVWVAGGIWQRLDYKTSNGSTQNAGDKLICEGYDIVMVNMPPYTVSGKSIDGGSDYIERNAFTVIEIINEINKRLAASGSSEQIVAVGPSMGGQITRYALRYMETHPADAKTNYGKHNCRLWVSFDSPHVGANIAYGGQAFLHYVGQWSRGEFAKEKYDKVLCNHAAKQMLQLHMADPNHWHQAYYAAVDALGYPNQLRRIAITNGSLNGTHTGYDHQLAVTIHSSLFSADIRMITAGSDTQNDNHVFYGHYPFGGAITYKQRFGQGCGADAAPGGTYNTFQQIYEPTMKSLMETTGPIINGPHCALNSPSHCFMPTYSTLGYWNGWQNSCQDLWNNGNRNLVAEGVIPFQSYWGPVGYNMEHVTCNPALVEYLFNEIETYIAGEKAMPVCTTQTITMHLPADRTNNTIVTWTCSPGLEILSGQGTPTVQVRAKTAGQAWIKATSSNLSYNKEVKQFDITVSGNSALPPLPSSFDITGNQHITWNTPVTLDRELNIRWNGELRITAPVYCTPGADIRIQGGGHLIIDGGTLTNACDGQTWPGIKVYTLSTLDPANFGAQGKVTLQNGATVSNAQTAIRVIAPEENSATAVLTGYIKATGASFVNNRTAIAFDAIRPAGSTSAGASALRSFSSFTLCTFETDNSYGFATHASLNSVRNVTFSGCTFSYANASPDPVLITATTAIKATDAGFTVQPSCVLNALYSFFYGPCPENTPRSTFNG
ncbi:MAG: hypothetical protein LBK03_01990, partial [Bacteroidales bacterium]|nr:hypothetical protein [Bacteroidales bacterium]